MPDFYLIPEPEDALDAELALCDQERAQQVCMLSEAGLSLAELLAYMRYGRQVAS